jgi:hypothetical protein
MTATVLELNQDGHPQRVAFRFEAPLEDPSFRWLRFQAGKFVPWKPPPLREQATLSLEWKPLFIGTPDKNPP